MNKSEKSAKIRLVLQNIEAQFPSEPGARLCFAILRQAAYDLLDPKEARSAAEYLRDAKHGELCGVDPVWVRESFEKRGLLKPLASNEKETKIRPQTLGR